MKKKKIILRIVVIIIILCILGGGCAVILLRNNGTLNQLVLGKRSIKGKLKDDWGYEVSGYESDILNNISASGTSDMLKSNSFGIANDSVSTSESTLGFSVGGSKNINNFRENIKNNYLPISTDITYNGLFYDYYFDTGKSEKSEELFSPSYSTAVSKDPISGIEEYYMTVGLNSNIKESDFQRKKLNIVVVMDISGSMSSGFYEYYYDGKTNNTNEDGKSKMQIANESLNLLIDELKPDDRLGIVLFDDEGYLAKPINLIEETDVEKIKEHILEIEPQGGTNFEAGYTKGTELFSDEMLNNEEYENRIIVITDAMPNLGKTSKQGLTEYVEKNAKDKIYTTFIGVGVDFNTEVIECLSDVKGANYYSVHSSEEFKKIMSEDFDYMVTPLVFDLELKLESDLFEIANIYGTDTKEVADGTIMKVNTLFPSSSNSSGEAKGGIILLKLKCISTCGTGLKEEIEGEKLKLSVSYKDRNGKQYSNSQEVQFKNADSEYYDNTGIRKGIVLTRYVNLMKNWILYERMQSSKNEYDLEHNRSDFLITDVKGISDCIYTKEEVFKILGENERTSDKLHVSEEYKKIFKTFEEYMKSEIEEVHDLELEQEVEILDLLVMSK